MRKCKDEDEMIRHMWVAAKNGMKLVRSSKAPMQSEHVGAADGDDHHSKLGLLSLSVLNIDAVCSAAWLHRSAMHERARVGVPNLFQPRSINQPHLHQSGAAGSGAVA